MPKPESILTTILDLQKTGQLAQLICMLKRRLRRKLSAAERAETQLALGVALTDKGDYPGGLRYVQQAQLEFEALDQPEQAASALAEQALNYHRRGGDRNQTQALELLQTASGLLKRLDSGNPHRQRSALAKIAFYFAVVSSYTNEREAAYQFYQEAYDLYQSSPYELAQVEDSLGKYYANLGRPTLARLYYEQSLARKTEVGDQFGQCITLSNLGLLHVERGDYAQARNLFVKAIAIGETIGNHHGLAIHLNELGRAYIHLHELDRALECLTRCLTHCGRKYPKTRALAHKNLAQLCLLQGQTNDGLAHIAQALRLFHHLKYAEGVGIAKRMEGRLLCAVQDDARALTAFRTAITLFRQVQKPHEVALTLLEVARIHQRAGQSAEAFETLKQALLIAEGLHDDLLVQRVQDELHQVNPVEALKIAIQRQVGREAALLSTSLSGRQEQITVLFSDIKDFSRFSATISAQEVVDTLNDYFWEMTRVVMERSGYVDKFIGDGLMAIFRGETKGHHAYRAGLAGLKMLERLTELNRERRRLGLWEIQVRIGIHTGEAIIGNIGSYDKMDYTAIGATVNLAQRLEAYARPNSVLISHATHQYISGHFTCFRRQPFVPKGFSNEVDCWEVRGARELIRFIPLFVGAEELCESRPDMIDLRSTGFQPRSVKSSEVNCHCEESATKQSTLPHPSPKLGEGAREGCSQSLAITALYSQDVTARGQECLSALIYRHPHLVLDHVAVGDIQQITIVMPHNPDFDTVLAAYFTQHLLEHGVLPVGAQELSQYACQIASHTLPPADCRWNTPDGVFQGILVKNRRYCAQHGLSQAHSDRYCVQRGFYLMEYLCLQVAEGCTLDDPNLFQDEYPFEQERKLLRERGN